MNPIINDNVPVTISTNLKKMLESKLKTESLLLRTSSAQRPQANQAQHPYYRTASLRIEASFYPPTSNIK